MPRTPRVKKCATCGNKKRVPISDVKRYTQEQESIKMKEDLYKDSQVEPDESKVSSDYSFGGFLPQPETKKEKPKKKGYKPKVVKEVIALKTCTVNLEGATVVLVEGQPVEGLTRQEQKHLKFHKFIK